MRFRKRFAKKSRDRTSFVVSFVRTTGVSRSSFALLSFVCFSLQLPGLVCFEGRLRRPKWAHLRRGSFCSVSAGRPRKRYPRLRASPRSSSPARRACAGCEPGPSSSTTAHRAPASCTQLTTYLGVPSEGCKGYRECRTGVEEAAVPSPKENSCRLVHR